MFLIRTEVFQNEKLTLTLKFIFDIFTEFLSSTVFGKLGTRSIFAGKLGKLGRLNL